MLAINKFLFLQLVLAHILADFSFQTKFVYNLKFKYSWGVIVHGSIFGILSLIFCVPYFYNPKALWYIIFLWISHILIDKIKTMITQKKNIDNLWLFLSDQFLHHLLIFIISIIGYNWTQFHLNSIWKYLCFDNSFLLFLISCIILTSPTTIFIYQIKKTFFLTQCSNQNTKYWEIIYRLFLFILMKMYYPISILVFIIIIFIFLQKKINKNSLINISLNTIIAFSIGLIK